MAPMAADAVFVDTNVLVYANQRHAVQHPAAVAVLHRLAQEHAVLWISRQVLREYVSAVTRQQGDAAALPMATALQRIEDFASRFEIAEEGPAVYDAWLDLLRRTRLAGKQVHDANLVATMQIHGIIRLLTFNESDFRRFGALVDLVSR
jgi:predicted nucleic acid-binding protein